MATLSFHSIPFSSSTLPTPSFSSSSSSLAFRTFFPFQNSKLFLPRRARTTCNNTNNNRRSRWLFVTKAVEEEVQQQHQQEEATTEQQPVVVPVSPSDTLTMFFQAEGTMSESAIPTVSKALEDIEGVASLKVQVLEGLATVELKKQTTVQATGVASSLVETIQGSGFKLQTLNLSFDEEYVAAE
ncbi:hypothetical protein HN51_009106 [Arachis hypogaea]|uniref:Uncharacterized protein n=1 Tax=Arachis hypogaea TaxID=3818 RepID=A0A445D0U1_ARAHY|nr:uncharacterized protein LOC112802518 [Arachis hypogaea]QHO43538.1 uncharacterized protein DS421_5g163580 [Arachis hypogaea]RYR56775.1 hypothetical protein Ahy_A05g022469 [Arachis hypogaea]